MENQGKYRIRPVRRADAPALLEIYRPYVERTDISFEYETPDVMEFASRIAAIAEEYPYLVCECDGHPVGYAYAHRHMERAAYGWNAEASVYLAEDCRGRGIGTALYGALIELLKMQGIRAAYACITQPNDRSMHLHEKLGFQTVGIFPNAGYKADAWHAIGWLRLAIGDYDGAPMPVIPYEELGSEQVDAVLAEYSEQLN